MLAPNRLNTRPDFGSTRVRSPSLGISSPAVVQVGRPAEGARRSRRCPAPADDITKAPQPTEDGRMNASCFPSGDQVGRLSRAFLVRRRTPVPSRFMLKMPDPRRVKAIRLPSREKAGADAGKAPFVSFLSPLPEGWTRKT